MELTVQEFLEHSILEKKIRNQIKIILKHFERIDKDAKYGCENWCVKEIYEKPNNMWDINMYALGNKSGRYLPPFRYLLPLLSSLQSKAAKPSEEGLGVV